jgi:hypothetical protein
MFNHDAAQIIDPHPAQTGLNVDIMSGILEDRQVLQFNCLGAELSEVTLIGAAVSVPVATVLGRVIAAVVQNSDG